MPEDHLLGLRGARASLGEEYGLRDDRAPEKTEQQPCERNSKFVCKMGNQMFVYPIDHPLTLFMNRERPSDVQFTADW